MVSSSIMGGVCICCCVFSSPSLCSSVCFELVSILSNFPLFCFFFFPFLCWTFGFCFALSFFALMLFDAASTSSISSCFAKKNLCKLNAQMLASVRVKGSFVAVQPVEIQNSSFAWRTEIIN